MSSRESRIVAGAALVAVAAACVWAVTVAEPKLQAHLDGDYLRISVPHLNFLNGGPLNRLRNGVTVAFIGQLTITSGPNAVVTDARSIARFAFSYDIWEERFSVTRFGDRPDLRRTISHLSSQAAENWCLDNLTIDHSLVPADRPFYVQLDLRAEDPHDHPGIVGEPGINITRLIQIFSTPAPSKGAAPRWFLTGGPYRMAELRKASHG